MNIRSITLEVKLPINNPETRIDKYLLENLHEGSLSGYSRSQLKILVEKGQILVNDKKVFKAGFLIKTNDQIVINLTEEPSSSFVASNAPLDILYEDENLLVINKSAGMSVHPGAGDKSNTVVNALIGHFRGDLPLTFSNSSETTKLRPGIVHRIDKNTTGIIVVAKDLVSLSNLSSQFLSKTTKRLYLALCLSNPRRTRGLDKADEGTVNASIGRDPSHRQRMSIDGIASKTAVTHWSVLQRSDYCALVKARLETGRTHQIRVHFASLGSPIIGDTTYGEFSALPSDLLRSSKEFGRQALHAALLGFTHPVSGKFLEFFAAPPSDFLALAKTFSCEIRDEQF